MRASPVALITVAIALGGGAAMLRAGDIQSQAPAPQALRITNAEASSVVTTFCHGCHNGVMRSPSGTPLDRLDVATMPEHLEEWTRAWHQLQAGTMPPAAAPRPDLSGYNTVLAAIESALDAAQPLPDQAGSAEIAARLAKMLWNSEPDSALREDAGRGRLTDAETARRHARRMLADERARSFVTRFFSPWIGLDRLAPITPDGSAMSVSDSALRTAMTTETELFVLSQLREDRDPIALWNADYTFVNESLARHYGMTGVSGAGFRRVTVPQPERAGLLGHASILTLTSRQQPGQPAPYTSPAARSVWVRYHFLGAAPPRPFPGAMPVRPDLPITPQTRALPANPCVNCHRNFFPLGYALEHFDALGRWRTRDEAGVVDASGTYVDGTPTNGVAELRQVLLQHPEAFRTTIVEQLIGFASGQPVNAARRASPEVLADARRILRGTATASWSTIIAAIASSTPR